MSKHPVKFFGEKFPSLSEDQAGANDFAVLRFAAEETNGTWQAGFYRLDSDLVELNEALRNLQR
ncbi:MAG TPA: hypothetical protein VE077_18905 [Candidatus Methylomirabilis sp.]|nr:hypothetical protein [Candidatus Methylomirabilis sp.]